MIKSRNVCARSIAIIALTYFSEPSLGGNKAKITVPPPVGPLDGPTCSLTATPPAITYHCHVPVSASKIELKTYPAVIGAAAFQGNQVALPFSTMVSGYGTYGGWVANAAGSETCTVSLGARCLYQGIFYPVDWSWGFHYSNRPDLNGWSAPPYCQIRHRCLTGGCAEQTGGWDVERGCWHGGCFAPESQLLTGDGQWKRADEIAQSDTLWNPVRERGFKIQRRIVGPEKLPLVVIGYGTVSVRVTTQHPMITKGGLKQASQIVVGDLVLGADRQYHAVTLVKSVRSKKEPVVYNFRLETDSENPDDHLIVSDGVVTGDHYLQEKLGNISTPQP